MGNAVIAGILFQPPSPPNALDFNTNQNSTNSNNNKKRLQNITVKYLWLYSQDEYQEWSLIPAIHITHNNGTYNSIGAQHQHQQQHQQQSINNTNSSSNSSQRYTLLYSHGNAEDLGLISSFLVDLARLLKIDVLCYDYSGYGVSAHEESVYEFWKGYGTKVEQWKEWRKRNNDGDTAREDRYGKGGDSTATVMKAVTSANGRTCRFTKEVFVAPMIHPPPVVASDNGGKDGDEEEEGIFDNACCNWTPDSAADETNDITQGAGAKGSPVPTPDAAGGNGGGGNSIASGSITSTGTSGSKKQRQLKRQQLFSRYSWNRPSPSETSCYTNICSAYDYLTKVEGVLPKHVILYGKSVGSGPTCWLAQKLCLGREEGCRKNVEDDGCSSITDEMCSVEGREPAESSGGGDGNKSKASSSAHSPGGVVLHSPFLSVIRVVLDFGFTTIGDLFPNFDRVGDFTCPVYVIHGSNDAIVPFYHGQTLFQTLPDSSKTVPFWARGAGHNNIEMDMPTAYIKRLQQFVRQCDRLNYPGKKKQQQKEQQLMLQQSLQASLMQSMQQQQQQEQQGRSFGKRIPFPKTFRPGLSRFASQDSYHMMMANNQGGANLATIDAMAPGSGSKPSKQRKQKGTLVMKSSPNHIQSPSPTSAQGMQRHPAPAANVHSSSPLARSNWADASRQQGMQQHQQQYALANNHVLQHRSMSTSAVHPPPPPPPTPVLQRHHSSHLQSRPVQTYTHHQQTQQLYHQHHQQQLQYQPSMEAFVNSHGGAGMQATTSGPVGVLRYRL
mmetsp:Transcript_32659/g.68981  ORF Transcript_32659/g.68981 Transcript_32659/m.68981 type:complete len:781 (+) Transcript_32659:740-3082(+)|eukprot:CAMPEP_0183730114 /NCGR_PEP_ID=MMETSP0737-20130205/32010_1 /TAXON_ID=385413 /ORGANISM="Thalassiosira miniscula, Strain CCMP1093" /LENGTH=780 /DNA_ID=CAMNT_0025962513 /DNA_START=599 /DNA_END=2941 /DNA_ORIENTATION=-